MSNVLRGFKIVELKDNHPYSLFHGTQRSRKLPLCKWILADIKTVKDGTNGKPYTSGWHFFKDHSTAVSFFERMFRVKKDRTIIVAYFTQNIRHKENSKKGACWLADFMYIPELFLPDQYLWQGEEPNGNKR